MNEKEKILKELQKVFKGEGLSSAIDFIKKLIKSGNFEHLRAWLGMLLDCLNDVKNKIKEEAERENLSDDEERELEKMVEEELNRGWYYALSGELRNAVAQMLEDAVSEAVENMLGDLRSRM